MRLDGRVALLTGSGSTIGVATAIALAREGADVALSYRSSRDIAEQTAERVRSAGRRAFVAQADVTDAADVQRLVQGVLDALGRIDILINVAGKLTSRVPVNKATEHDWDMALDLNAKSAFLSTTAVVNHMLQRGSGRIVNVSSVGIKGDFPAQAHYTASKGALNAYTKGVAFELAPHGITVNAVAPGVIESHAVDLPAEAFDFIMRQIPIGRACRAEEVAEPIVFLCTDGASFITGQTIHVNGGHWMP